ncbi:hypothetical protein AWV79_27260 [Cupriavidus sp. UYMMa02A]|nr:hypothetical protein AWV79_27260 [Cupriavidus sp. UYMMa02A]
MIEVTGNTDARTYEAQISLEVSAKFICALLDKHVDIDMNSTAIHEPQSFVDPRAMNYRNDLVVIYKRVLLVQMKEKGAYLTPLIIKRMATF